MASPRWGREGTRRRETRSESQPFLCRENPLPHSGPWRCRIVLGRISGTVRVRLGDQRYP